MQLARLSALAAIVLLLSSLTWSAAAQDAPATKTERAQQPASEPAEQNAAADPATEGQAETPAADGSASQKFEQLFADWKALLKQLREIKVKYQAAPREERGQLQEQWDAAIAKGEELLPQVVEAGVEAFREAPNADPQLSRWLVTVCDDYLKSDQYEKALELSRSLIDAKCDNPRVYDVAGIASFSLDQFEQAKQYLEEAQKAGATSGDSAGILAVLDDYLKYWEEEQKLREAEANSDLPRVRLQTSKGDIEIELFEDQAPETVGNFVSLVEKGFYDNTPFHRVLPNFMAQGGDREGTGQGGPGYDIYDELGDNARKHFRGSLSMAKEGQEGTPDPRPNSAGSQFFLTFRPTPHLNDKYTVFGRVINGLEVLEKLQRRDPEKPNPPQPDVIVKAEVIRKRDHEYAPHKVE